MKTWTLIAGGPSIEDVVIDRDTVGEVVAINRAWYKFPEVRYWSASERPLGLWNSYGHRKVCDLIKHHKPVVWAPRRPWADYWRRTFKEQGLVVEDYQFANGGRVFMPPPWEGSECEWASGTTLVTLALLCYRGAEHIRLLGVDQRGVGGYRNGTPNQGPGWWKERWEKEGDMLRRIIAEAATHGVEIDWRRAAEPVAVPA